MSDNSDTGGWLDRWVGRAVGLFLCVVSIVLALKFSFALVDGRVFEWLAGFVPPPGKK